MPGSRAYFDTSVVTKRYVREARASFARALLRRHRGVSSAVLPLELMSALCRRREVDDLAPRDFALIQARLSADRARWDLVEVTASVLGRAEQLVQITPLRSLDAIHIASALVIQETAGMRLRFITADHRQRAAAAAAGLEVVWAG
jgi:predicted nucleic acid-binding protein